MKKKLLSLLVAGVLVTSPPPPTVPAIAEYPRIVPIAIVTPVINDVLTSTSSTLIIILPFPAIQTHRHPRMKIQSRK